MSTSRFAYNIDDDPGEGGVTSVSPPSRKSTGRSFNGIPGPAELLLDVSELVRTVGMRYTHRFAIPAGAIPDLESVAPVVGHITLTNTGAALLLTGKVQSTLSMECVRCLKPTEQASETELEESFDLVANHTAYNNQDEIKAVDENIEAAVIDGTILNLGDLLRQNLLLAAPLQPFCAGGCTNGISVPEEELETAVPNTPLAALGALWEKRSS